MRRYKCVKCGYVGGKLIFQFTDYSYCTASNSEDPEYIGEAPQWVKKKGLGEGIIGEPVGCPKCHNWGAQIFEIVEIF